MIEVAASKDYKPGIWKTDVLDLRYQLFRVAGLSGSTIRFEVVNPNSPRRIVVVKAKCLGQILLTGPYKVYIKRTGTQVDKLNTCNMSVTSYTVTFK